MPGQTSDRRRRSEAKKAPVERAPLAGHVNVVFAASARQDAAMIGAQLHREGFEVTSLALVTNMVDVVRRSDPDVLLIVFIAKSFDVVRLCRDLSADIGCRIVVVVVADPQTNDAELDDDLVIEMLDAGAHVVLPRTTSSPVLAARLRAAIRTIAPRSPSR